MASDLLMSVDELHDRLMEVRILDVRGEVATTEPRYRAYLDRYREGHIPGAVFADWRHDFTDRMADVPVTLAPPDVFEMDAARLGIGADTVVVAYDDYRNALAGRIVWVLRSYGHSAAHLLDGGLQAWTDAGYELETREPPTPPVNPPVRAGDVDGLVGIDAVHSALDEGVQVVDARSTAQYTGADTHSRRAGHIPGAVTMPYTDLLADDGRFLPQDELAARLERPASTLLRPRSPTATAGCRRRSSPTRSSSPAAPARRSTTARGTSGATATTRRSTRANDPAGMSGRLPNVRPSG